MLATTISPVVFAAALVGLLAAVPHELSAQSPPAVFRTMSTADLRATGVDRLTPAERERLEAWIARLTTNVAQLAASSACQGAPAPATSTSLESRIAGDFTGWDGLTVIVLENGQVWQQASFDRTAIYLQRPRVSLFGSGGDWRMSVEGLSNTVAVRRLR